MSSTFYTESLYAEVDKEAEDKYAGLPLKKRRAEPSKKNDGKFVSADEFLEKNKSELALKKESEVAETKYGSLQKKLHPSHPTKAFQSDFNAYRSCSTLPTITSAFSSSR